MSSITAGQVLPCEWCGDIMLMSKRHMYEGTLILAEYFKPMQGVELIKHQRFMCFKCDKAQSPKYFKDSDNWIPASIMNLGSGSVSGKDYKGMR